MLTRRRRGPAARPGFIPLGTGQRQNARDGALEPLRAPQSQKPPTDTSDVLAPVWDAMSEAEFQQHVEDALKTRGYLYWHVRDPRLMKAGLPDIIAVHPTKLPRRVLFFELKTMQGRVKPKQREALAALADVYGVDARIIRPSEWPAVLEDL